MQSCDICRKRKVRCDSRSPCARCRRLHQQCTYNNVLRKRGPKFLHRYPSIFTISSTSPSATDASESSISRRSLPPMQFICDVPLGINTGLVRQTSTVDPRFQPEPDAGTMTTLGLGFPMEMQETLRIYLERLHPLYPVINLEEIQTGYGWNRNELLCAICAAVHAQASSQKNNQYNHQQCEKYLKLALKYREVQDINDNTSPNKVLVTFLLFITYWSLNREVYAWWYLRESIALILSFRMHRQGYYQTLGTAEADKRRVLFWSVFIAERTFCLLYNKPITLRPWIHLPGTSGISENECLTAGFIRRVILFQSVEIDLAGHWTPAGFVTPLTLGPTPEPDTELGQGLPIQEFHYAITREWLRAKIWKLGIPGQACGEFVASAENVQWRFDEPVRIAEATLGILRRFKTDLRDFWCVILDQMLCDICKCLYDIKAVMQTKSGDLDLTLEGLQEVLSGYYGQSVCLLARQGFSH